jgi:hypothetical protein
MPAKRKKTSGKKMPAKKKPEVQHVHHKCKSNSACGGAVYFMGFIGALVYYLSTAQTFWVGLYGVLKALLWPGFLVFEILKFLGV